MIKRHHKIIIIAAVILCVICMILYCIQTA